jgi:hypothetical protein
MNLKTRESARLICVNEASSRWRHLDASYQLRCANANSTQKEEIMGHLILQDNTFYPGFSLLGESTLAITFDPIPDIMTSGSLQFLVLSGTTSVSSPVLGESPAARM